MVDARLPDGSRLHAVIPPLAIDGPYVTIRRFGARAVPLDAFGLGDAPSAFLGWAVMAGWNLLVAGGTSAGKTTLLNTLSGAIPAAERVVTIEETAELRLAQPHVVRLEARPPNAEGAGGVGVRALVRAALRMRPDRVVVGEVRGVEALDMLQALNTGHDGSMSTIHANGAADALSRLETLVLLADAGLPLVAVRAQVIASVDAVVFVARRPGGVRRVEAIAEVVDGDERVRPLFAWESGALRPVSSPRRAARRPDAAPRRPELVPVLTLALAIAARSCACCSSGRRDARSPAPACGGSPRARSWRLPPRLRVPLARRLHDADVGTDPETAVGLWLVTALAVAAAHVRRWSPGWRYPPASPRWSPGRSRCGSGAPAGSGGSPRRCRARSSRSRPSSAAAAP